MPCRANRIGLNIVHDHAPAAFMADLPGFVRQVDDFDPLNLFATALRDEDVAKSMYAGMDGGTSESKCPCKTNAVCRALRPVLQLLDQQRYMPTMLTTLVRQSPADIPSVLQLPSPPDAEARDAALMCLLYLSDVDTVDNAALGMYDLPLALAVAQRSQHDPREYLPAQRKVHAIASDEYHRYKIDVQLALHDQVLQPKTTRLCCGASCADSVGPTWPTGGRQAGSRSRQSTTRQSGPAQSWPITTALPTPPLCCSTMRAHTRTPWRCLCAALDTLLEDVEESTAALATKAARLRQARATPLEVLAAAHVEMRAGGGEAPDNVDVVSDTASMASQFTSFTGTATNASTATTGSTARRASKARMKKKVEKHRTRRKKGSIFEEACLVDSVAKLIDRVRALQPSVRSLCLALIQFGRTRAAQQVHSALRRLVLLVLDDADWVFAGQPCRRQAPPLHARVDGWRPCLTIVHHCVARLTG
ncbi:putative elongator complex protein 1 [Coemansia helicoidea]|uniref:Elongator complex protein 1 n=1 Tax=Coemansia helicoidea TaxID=1286919 RepID=A0ACC1L6P2_9FUNG|nr:putative elongator complex protein 1 [Coemansia helicoidea]